MIIKKIGQPSTKDRSPNQNPFIISSTGKLGYSSQNMKPTGLDTGSSWIQAIMDERRAQRKYEFSLLHELAAINIELGIWTEADAIAEYQALNRSFREDNDELLKIIKKKLGQSK